MVRDVIAHFECQRQHPKLYKSGYSGASGDRWAQQLAAARCAKPQGAVSAPPTGRLKNGGIISDIFLSAGAQLLALGDTQSPVRKLLA